VPAPTCKAVLHSLPSEREREREREGASEREKQSKREREGEGERYVISRTNLHGRLAFTNHQGVAIREWG